MARRTKYGLPTYCSIAVDRHGKKRIRFRRGSFSTYLTAEPGTKEFQDQYWKAMAGSKPLSRPVGTARTAPGSLNELIALYYQSPLFDDLADSTKRVYRNILERFRAKYGAALVADFNRRHFAAIIGEMTDRKTAANNLMKRLHVLFEYAIEIDMLDSNPTDHVRRYRVTGSGIHSWTEDEIRRFEEHHPIGTKARLALALMLYTGQRRSDVVRMGRQHVKDGRITVTQQKTRASLQIAMHPALLHIINETDIGDHLTFLTTHFGAPYTSAGFGNWFREQCDAAGLPQCSAHGLRKAAARRLAEAGLSMKQIAAVTGHKTLKEIERYTAAADQIALADAAILSISPRTKK